MLVLALILTSLPSRLEGAELPGTVSDAKIYTLLGILGGVVALLVYVKVTHKGAPQVKLETPPVKFNDVVAGEPTKRSVPVTNIMNDPVTVKAVTMDDKSGAFAIGDARQVPFTLAPGEKFEIHVTLSPKNGGGKARVRIVATTAKLKKDTVKFISVSYGHRKSKLGKLVPGRG
jgi:hypothetical protein